MKKKDMIKAMVSYYTDGNKAAFARLLGVPPQTLSSWETRGILDAELIYSKCKDINAKWLLSGEGSMIENEESVNMNSQQLGDNNSGTFINGNNIQLLEKQQNIELLRTEIAGLKSENDLLRNNVDDLRKDKEALQRDKDTLQFVIQNFTSK